MNKDTIYKQDVLKTVGLIKSKHDRISVFSDDFDVISRTETMIAISNLLPAQPERKKGKWIDYSEDGFVECPFCHSATNCDGNKDELHYCFSCGADMRGKQNE